MLGIVVFFKADDTPVALLFIGLTCIYVSDFFASLFQRAPLADEAATAPARELGERALGFFHLVTGAG